MGDAADYLNEQHDGYDDEFADRATCKYCDRDDLYWEETEHGWRLFQYFTGKLHTCKKHPSQARQT